MVDWRALCPHSLDDFSGPPTVVGAYEKVFPKAAVYAGVFVAAWLVFLVLLRLAGFGEMICGTKRGSWALKSAMLLHHGLITPLAIVGIFEDPAISGMYSCLGCREFALRMNRDSLPPLAARALTPVTLGYFMGDLLLLSQWNLTKSGAVENGLMLFHHVASLVVWPTAVYFDWVARYVIIMLSYEFTSFWLTVIWMLGAADMKKSKWYVLAGLIFTLSFVVMRMVGALPQLVAMYNAPPWSNEMQKGQTGGILHEWAWIFSASLVAPHLLNLFWGVKVVRGFAAVVFGGGKKKPPTKGE